MNEMDKAFAAVGLSIGHAHRSIEDGILTGCTVILVPDETCACIDIRGCFDFSNRYVSIDKHYRKAKVNLNCFSIK
jgi:L-aminopeptidase/D-esterase-like protein